MKKLVEEGEGEGFLKLMGKRVTVWCCRYIYSGKLIGVNDDCILLTDCGVVFETGPYDDDKWKDYQKLPNDQYIMKSAIESFGVLK